MLNGGLPAAPSDGFQGNQRLNRILRVAHLSHNRPVWFFTMGPSTKWFSKFWPPLNISPLLVRSENVSGQRDAMKSPNVDSEVFSLTPSSTESKILSQL